MRIFGANLSREMVFISGKENAQIARNEKQFFPIRFLNVTAISLHHFIQKEGEGTLGSQRRPFKVYRLWLLCGHMIFLEDAPQDLSPCNFNNKSICDI